MKEPCASCLHEGTGKSLGNGLYEVPISCRKCYQFDGIKYETYRNWKSKKTESE